MIRSRDDLKGAFRSGAIPTAANFGDVFDSFALVDELSPLGKLISDIDARTSAVEQKVATPSTVRVNADGVWQVLRAGIDAIGAYEILAHIEKTQAFPYAAVTHAIAVVGATGSRPAVRQTQSYSQGYWPWGAAGFLLAAAAGVILATKLAIPAIKANDLAPLNASVPFWVGCGVGVGSLVGAAICLFMQSRRAVTVRWRASGNWFTANPKYDLIIRSGCDYGSKTQKVAISCQIKRLWS